MGKFLEYSVVKKLTALAEKPFDLKKITPDRLNHFVAESCGLKFLYGTEKVTDEVMKQLFELASESKALQKMEKMQAGDVVNFIEGFPSEDRPALHTATRDFFDPNPSQKAKEAASLAKNEIEKLKVFIKKAEKKFKNLVLIGIGGSDLGPQANYLALKYLQKPEKKIYFISNVDPDNAAEVFLDLNLNETLVLVVSKSGKTLETAVNEEFAKEKFKKGGINPKDHFVSITTPKSPMDNPENYLASFYIWDWIGGRYSSTSMVGGVLLSFAFGFDIFWEFLRGASAMDKAALVDDIKVNIPLVAALLAIWNRNFLHYPTVALIPYSNALKRYPAHIQQVTMESNGKWIDQQGQFVHFSTSPVIWGEPGTNGQHSFFQLIHQGTDPIPVSMIGFKENQYGEDILIEGTTSQEKLLANMFAQSLALASGQVSENPNKVFPGNRPTNLLLGQKLTPFTLGAILSYFENMVAFQGFIWGINSFDQEGVQLGKVLANKIIDRMKEKKTDKTDLIGSLLNKL